MHVQIKSVIPVQKSGSCQEGDPVAIHTGVIITGLVEEKPKASTGAGFL